MTLHIKYTEIWKIREWGVVSEIHSKTHYLGGGVYCMHKRGKVKRSIINYYCGKVKVKLCITEGYFLLV